MVGIDNNLIFKITRFSAAKICASIFFEVCHPRFVVK